MSHILIYVTYQSLWTKAYGPWTMVQSMIRRLWILTGIGVLTGIVEVCSILIYTDDFKLNNNRQTSQTHKFCVKL